MSKTVLFALAALACLALVAHAAPANDDSMMFLRMPRAAQREVMRGYVGFRRRNGYPSTYAHGFAGARTQQAPTYAMPIEDEEDAEQDEPERTKPEPQPVEAEEPQEDEEEDMPAPAPVAPTKRPSRARPQRPAKAPKPQRPVRPSTTAAPADDDEEDYDEPAPPKRGSKDRGATAIATAVSRGDGASALSNAVAYGGTFSGGVFRHRYQKTQ